MPSGVVIDCQTDEIPGQAGDDLTVMTDMIVMPDLIGHLIKQQLSATDSFCCGELLV